MTHPGNSSLCRAMVGERPGRADDYRPGGNLVESLRIAPAGDLPYPQMLWQTGWVPYPGSEWQEEPPGHWSRAVFPDTRWAETVRGRPCRQRSIEANRETARQIELQRPGWMVLWGVYSKQYVAFPLSAAPPGTILTARYAPALAARMARPSAAHKGPCLAMTGKQPQHGR